MMKQVYYTIVTFILGIIIIGCEAPYVEAEFPPVKYMVTLSVNDSTMGTVSGAGQYLEETQATIAATPNRGHEFIEWSDTIKDNPRKITVHGDIKLVAFFKAIPQYTITAQSNDVNMGFVSGGGTYYRGDTIFLQATPANAYGYKFVHWDDGNTDNPRTIVVTEDKTYTANFAVATYTIIAQPNNASMGNVTGGGTYDGNTQIILTATPSAGYRFINWNDGNTDNPRIITVIEDKGYIANFTYSTYTITAIANDATMGSVTGGGTYNENTQVTLTAVPATGYAFVNWNDGNTDNPRTITVAEDKTYTANFTISGAQDVREYVDLGLPSGTLWATCNVGASSPEDYGKYFAWGEVLPKTSYDWSEYGDYKWGIYNSSTSPNYGMTKYNKTDGKTTLDASDDAAQVNWGGDWRMPTYAEQEELVTKCTWIWTTQNGVKGCKVVGPNGNSIFLPATGYRNGDGLYQEESCGYYWSSSLSGGLPSRANRIGFDSKGATCDVHPRYGGRTIRAVYAPQ